MSTRISKTDTADVALYEKVNEIADGIDGQVGYRKPNTEYAVETVRACAYHPEFQLKCTTAGITGAGELDTSGSYKEGDKIEDGTVVWEITTVGSGSGRNVGDIFYTTRTDTELNGAVECNGSTYNINDFTGEQAIGNLLALDKVPYVSLSEYQTAIDTNGSCRAFGWDGGDSFRVPTLNDVYIEAGVALTAGEFINESLPNITGIIGATGQGGGGYGVFYAPNNSGAFKAVGSPAQYTVANGAAQNTRYINMDFNASRSSSTYQDSAKVKPDSVRYRAMVHLANEATDEALITATSALQQVANKVDKTSATDRATVVSWGMPSASYVNISGSSYTAPANGYVFHQSAMPKHGSVVLKNTTTGMAVMEASEYATARTGYAYIHVRKGDTVKHEDNGTGHAYTTTYFRFYYAEGEL